MKTLYSLYTEVVIQPDNKVTGKKNGIPFSADLSLLRIREAIDLNQDVSDEIWSIQDGYGDAGLTPIQGWDWSGIRDSSDAATKRMENVAKTYISDKALAKLLGVKTLRQLPSVVKVHKMKQQPYYERRGTMIYTEAPAKYIAECQTVAEADEIVRRLNELTEIVNSGLGIEDVQ